MKKNKINLNRWNNQHNNNSKFKIIHSNKNKLKKLWKIQKKFKINQN